LTSKRDVEVSLADYKDKLTFDYKDDCVIITKAYEGGAKGKEEWGNINAVVKTELGGKWVSMGRDSHWVVPLEAEEKQAAEEKGNNGTYAGVRCPYCGKTIDVSFKPRKEAS